MLTPPTDSLYKFLAVFGLVLIVTGFLMENKAPQSINEALASKLVEDAKVGEQLLAQTRRQLELTNQLREYDPKTLEGARQQKKILDKMQEERSLQKSRHDFESSESYIRATETWEFVKGEYVKTVGTGVDLWTSGIYVAALGFFLWYVKIQRHLDKQLVASTSAEQSKRGTHYQPE